MNLIAKELLTNDPHIEMQLYDDGTFLWINRGASSEYKWRIDDRDVLYITNVADGLESGEPSILGDVVVFIKKAIAERILLGHE